MTEPFHIHKMEEKRREEGRKNMELSLMLIEQIMVMVIMALAGFLAAKAGVITGKESRTISQLVIYVAVPCALTDAFQTELDGDKLEGLAVAFLASCVLHALYLAMTWLLARTGHPLTPGEQGSVIYSNSVNLVMPIIAGTLGTEYIIYTCPYMVAQSALMWTHGQALMGGEKQLNLKKIVTNPCICSIFLGMVLFFLQIRLPGAPGSAVSSLGSCIGPLSMVVIGILLAETDLKQALTSVRMYWVTGLRLLVFPLVSAAVLWGVERCWGHGEGEAVMLVTLLCAIGPSATTITQLAQMFRSPESRYVSSINAVTTLLCVVTMPIMILLFQMLPA